MGVLTHAHARGSGGSGGMLPQENFTNQML